MKGKHTPGPWKNVSFDEAYKASIQAPNSRCNIGTLGGFGTNQETTQANARLIAAAPELLELVKRTLAVADDDCPRRYIQDAKQLIAKIEGEDL